MPLSLTPRGPRRTKLRRVLVSVATTCASLAVLATPADAAPRYSLSASIAGSGCTSQTTRIGWWGSNESQATMAYQPKGDVYVCWTKYRLNDTDPNGDYYSMVATSVWRHTAGNAGYSATSNQSIRSSLAAKDNVYGSTGSFTSSTSCTTPFTIGYAVGPISASTTPSLCSSHTVSRIASSSSNGFWNSTKAGRLRVVETSLTQKVPQGAVPRFDVSFGIPQYTHSYNGFYYVPSSHLVYQSFTGR